MGWPTEYTRRRDVQSAIKGRFSLAALCGGSAGGRRKITEHHKLFRISAPAMMQVMVLGKPPADESGIFTSVVGEDGELKTAGVSRGAFRQ